MELSGTREIAADRALVWAALNDPEVLKAAIPGCQEMTGSPEDGFEATVKQKVGPVSATFKGKVQLTNVVAGESYTISGEGKGGAAGFAKGGADVRLEDAGGGTRLSYEVRATVGGKLAQLGSRIIDGFAKKMADQFFENFQKEVEGPGAAPAEEPGAAAGAAQPAGAGAVASPAPAAAPPDPATTAAASPGPVAASAPSPKPAAQARPAAEPAPAEPAGGEGVVARVVAWLRGLFGGRS